MQVVDWISKQAGKLADNFNNYKFYVKQTPEKVDSSAILSLSAYASREQEALVPCLYRWFRLKNGLVTEVEDFKGNTFIVEPGDVGCIIQAEVTVIRCQRRAQTHSTPAPLYSNSDLSSWILCSGRPLNTRYQWARPSSVWICFTGTSSDSVSSPSLMTSSTSLTATPVHNSSFPTV